MIFATVGALTTASRMTWAFARERGLPGSAVLSRVSFTEQVDYTYRECADKSIQVEPRTSMPLWSILCSTVISLLLALINIGSTVAFNAFTGLAIAGFYSSFLVVAVLMLLARTTKQDASFRWGPFRLRRLGVPVNVFSIAYSIIGIFFSFWPPNAGPTASSMNWSCAVYGGVLLFSLCFWFSYGRKVYTGPIIERHVV